MIAVLTVFSLDRGTSGQCSHTSRLGRPFALDDIRKALGLLSHAPVPGAQALGHPDGATFWIYDRGTHALEVASTERATFTRQWQTTNMVGVAKTKAQACIEIHNRHGLSAPVCTPFFGH